MSDAGLRRRGAGHRVGASSTRDDTSAVEIHPAQQNFESAYPAPAPHRQVLSAGTVEPSGQSLQHRRDLDAAVGVAHQMRLAGLFSHSDVRLGQVRETPDRMSEVVHAAPRSDIGVEVDKCGGLLTAEDGVVRAQVPMTDGLLVGAKSGGSRRVVEVPDQTAALRS